MPAAMWGFTNTWWFQTIGWIGSGLVVLSLVQSNLLRFRWLNFIGAVIATIWNFFAGMWPFVAMNGAIMVIDAYWLLKLQKQKSDANAYQVIEVSPNDTYLNYLLTTNAKDISNTFDVDFARRQEFSAQRSAFLVLSGDETIGMVEVEDSGNGVGTVVLDWVNPKYRDFTPGQYVFGQSGVFAAKGFTKLVVPAVVEGTHAEYLGKVGFIRTAAGWERDV